MCHLVAGKMVDVEVRSQRPEAIAGYLRHICHLWVAIGAVVDKYLVH